jgi:hypothetical protein
MSKKAEIVTVPVPAQPLAALALRWLDQSGPCALNTTVRLPRLKLLRPNMMPKSYSVLPATSIHNGALLIAADEFYWAVMSPREQEEYMRVNTTS